MSGYARPSRLSEALRILARAPRAVLAGGTDFYPSRVAQALPAEVLDITALRPGELVTAVLVPKPDTAAASHFLKLGARKYLVISIVMASAVIEHRSGKVVNARVAVGSCSPVALRLPALEAQLKGKRFDASLADWVNPAQLAVLEPIADVRASADYRKQAALELVRRLLREMA